MDAGKAGKGQPLVLTELVLGLLLHGLGVTFAPVFLCSLNVGT